jgi:hypothetical protein
VKSIQGKFPWAVQKKFPEALQMKCQLDCKIICDFFNGCPIEFYKEMEDESNECNEYFKELCESLRHNHDIATTINKYKPSDTEKDVVLNHFIWKKLPRCILTFDYEKIINNGFKPNFILYLRIKPVRVFCYEYYEKKNKKRNKTESIDDNYPDVSNEDYKEDISRERIEICVEGINKIRSKEENKLLFHRMRLLPLLYNKRRPAILKGSKFNVLKELKGLTLKNVSIRIDEMYSGELGEDVNYMNEIRKKMEEKGEAEDIFLDGVDLDINGKGGRGTISSRLKDVGKSLKIQLKNEPK